MKSLLDFGLLSVMEIIVATDIGDLRKHIAILIEDSCARYLLTGSRELHVLNVCLVVTSIYWRHGTKWAFYLKYDWNMRFKIMVIIWKLLHVYWPNLSMKYHYHLKSKCACWHTWYRYICVHMYIYHVYEHCITDRQTCFDSCNYILFMSVWIYPVYFK